MPALFTDTDPTLGEDSEVVLEPDTNSLVTQGVFTSASYVLKQMVNNLILNCGPHTIYPFKSAILPQAWTPYLQAAPPHPDGTRALRDYYPLPHHMKEFDEWQMSHPRKCSIQTLLPETLLNHIPSQYVAELVPGTAAFNLCSIPTYWEDEIPPVPLPYLIMAAISGSVSGLLTEREVKLALIRRFPYFAKRLTSNSRWQVRIFPTFSQTGNRYLFYFAIFIIQISVNWILNRYTCFEPIKRDPTPDPDDNVSTPLFFFF